MKDLTSIKPLGRNDLEGLVAAASRYREAIDSRQHFDQVMTGKTVSLLFFEPSTRTRLSFDLASQRLGAHVLTFDPARSSTIKGESLRDTVLTITAIGSDLLVVRHADEGVPDSVAAWTGVPVINAGDGANEHPTQALLDAVTISRHFGGFEGLRMAIVGDIVHSRVAGSLAHAMTTVGVDLTLVGPEEWTPENTGLKVSHELDEVVADLDVVYLLRVQTERGGEITDDYIRRFQIDRARLAALGEDTVIMHPGPMNRGVEIAEEVADSPRSLVMEQVRNGVPARMAVLAALGGGG